MQRVTIDYRQIEAEALWRSFQPRWPRYLVHLVMISGLLHLFLWPMLGWFVLEERWLSLGVLEILMLFWAAALSNNATRQGLEQLRRTPPIHLTIQPEGLEVESDHNTHLVQGWRKFRAVQRSPHGLVLPYVDYSLTLGYVIPAASFANPAAAEAFAAAAEQAIANKDRAPAVAATKLLERPRGERYRLRYQLTRTELHTDDAKAELLRLHPDTLVNDTAAFVKKSRTWKYFVVLGLFIGLIWFEDRLIPINHALEGMLFLLGGIVYMRVFTSAYPRVLAWLRTIRKTPAPPVEVWLGDAGIFRTAPDEMMQIPWSGVDNLLVHAERLTLWRRDWCRLIIPQRVFDSPEQAHECERWIQTILQKQYDRLAVAELAEPEPTIELQTRPASDNPYQAPLS